MLGLRDRLLQLGGENVAEREQFLERLADERELLRETGHPVHLATGHRRPGVLGSDDPLLGLREHQGVEATEHADRVVDRRVVREAVSLAHRREPRRAAAVAGRRALRAEEQQVLRKALRHVGLAARDDAVLRQQARGDALAEDVKAEQPVRLGLEHGGGELPERCDLRRSGSSAEPGADLAHPAGGGRRVGGAHQRQQLGFDRRLGRGIGLERLCRRVGRQLAPLPVERPEVGRMHAVGAGVFLHGAVLREQRQRRHLLAGEQPAQVVEQCERCSLDVVDNQRGQLVRLRDEPLYQRFARAQDHRRGGLADEFERTDALVDLRARVAQHGGVDGVDVGSDERVGLLDKAAQRLVRGFE